MTVIVINFRQSSFYWKNNNMPIANYSFTQFTPFFQAGFFITPKRGYVSKSGDVTEIRL